ncbi:MAG: class I SAM-dependent DNA methyltransferase [Thermoguttaceae bacterium]
METRQTKPFADPRIAFFDQLAQNWDDCEQNPQETIAAVNKHAELLDLSSGSSLLEVGCGTGQLTPWLADRIRPGRIKAVDFSPTMLQKAVAKGIAAEFRLADVCRDDLGQAEFDVALCFHSFPHFRNQPAALLNLARCLRPQGRLIVMHLHGSEGVNAFHRDVGGVIGEDLLPAKNQWQDWLDAAGLKIAKYIDEPQLFFLQAISNKA